MTAPSFPDTYCGATQRLPQTAPRLSVVIRNRNEAGYLRQVFDALMAQRCSFWWEIVVVDNESTDGSLDLYKEYDVRVISVPRDQFSYGRLLNMGIEAAQGELVLTLSAHALPVGSTFLEACVAPFADPLMGAVRCLGAYSTPQDMLQWYRPVDFHFPTQEAWQQVTMDMRWFSQFPIAACSVLRRKVWEEAPYDETLEAAEDKVWAAQVLARGYKVRRCAEAVYFHMRERKGMALYQKKNREWRAIYRVLGYAPMTWPRFFKEAALAILAAPLVAARYVARQIIQNWYLVIVPRQARRDYEAGSLPEFDRHV